jgi:hypothetical protein
MVAWSQPYAFANEVDTLQVKGFPRGHLFQPLVADPKQPLFRLSSVWVNSDSGDSLVGIAAAGESLGMARFFHEDEAHQVHGGQFQIDLSGGIIAQFDLLGESSDLINADYIIGIPLSYRIDNFSLRGRIYHQSSHLGDEFLLNTKPPPTRVNLSFESLELLAAYQLSSLRLYGGGEWIVRRDPDDLDPGLFHSGFEYRHSHPLGHFASDWVGTLLVALDVKFWEEHDYYPSFSLKTGFEFGMENDFEQRERHWRLLLEAYQGIAPFGQFFSDDQQLHSLGLGVQFSL